MEYDLELAKNCTPDTAILRFYGWQPYCISLGANQSFDDITLKQTKKNNIDVVKRPTGGRAILHAEELTYSVIIPNVTDINGLEFYKSISNALVFGLKKYHLKLTDVALETQQPDFPKLLKESEGAICFGSTAKSEIKYNGKKLVGSAQRKIGSTLLQHGSILIGPYHQNLVNYLKVDEEKRQILRKSISEKTTDLSSILKESINVFELQEKIIEGFIHVFNANFIPELTHSNEF